MRRANWFWVSSHANYIIWFRQIDKIINGTFSLISIHAIFFFFFSFTTQNIVSTHRRTESVSCGIYAAISIAGIDSSSKMKARRLPTTHCIVVNRVMPFRLRRARELFLGARTFWSGSALITQINFKWITPNMVHFPRIVHLIHAVTSIVFREFYLYTVSIRLLFFSQIHHKPIYFIPPYMTWVCVCDCEYALLILRDSPAKDAVVAHTVASSMAKRSDKKRKRDDGCMGLWVSVPLWNVVAPVLCRYCRQRVCSYQSSIARVIITIIRIA